MNSIVTNSYPSVSVSDTKTLFKAITLGTPASQLISDLDSFPYIVVDSHTLATDARKFLKQSRKSLVTVINNNNQFLGILDNRDFDEQELFKKISQGYALSEIEVSDLLHAREILHSLSERIVNHMTVMSLVRRLRYCEDRILLVLDRNTNEMTGILSAVNIARQLQMHVAEDETMTFRRLFKLVESNEQALLG